MHDTVIHDAAMSTAVMSTSVSDVDVLDGFVEWLVGRGCSLKHAKYMRSYVVRYLDVLRAGRLSILEGVRGRHNVMEALANFMRYQGLYGEWKRLKEEYGLKWKQKKVYDVFSRIYDNEIEGIEEWIDSCLREGDEVLKMAVVFMALTGLRTGEAIVSLNKIAEEGLGGYLKDGLLEHFRDKRFLRGSKNAYVTVLLDELIPPLEEWKKRVSYMMLVKRCRKRGLKLRFYDLRRWYATVLRNHGIPSELVDMLQGRISGTVFVQSYYRPNFADVKEKVREILKPYAQRWLKQL